MLYLSKLFRLAEVRISDRDDDLERAYHTLLTPLEIINNFKPNNFNKATSPIRVPAENETLFLTGHAYGETWKTAKDKSSWTAREET